MVSRYWLLKARDEIDFKRKERRYVSYGDNNYGKILGKGVVGNPSTITIKDVMSLEGLKDNHWA